MARAGWPRAILTRALTPGDALHVPGAEYLQCAGSLDQARVVFRFIRAALEPTGDYVWSDSHQRIGAVHRPTNTRLRVLSSNGKTAMGIVGCPLLVADEPGSWEVKGGELMQDAIFDRPREAGEPAENGLHRDAGAVQGRMVAGAGSRRLARLYLRHGAPGGP